MQRQEILNIYNFLKPLSLYFFQSPPTMTARCEKNCEIPIRGYSTLKQTSILKTSDNCI